MYVHNSTSVTTKSLFILYDLFLILETVNALLANIVSELEKNLDMIEEIDGYIRIVRSFPLMSLNFLKNLKVIRGNVLDNQK